MLGKVGFILVDDCINRDRSRFIDVFYNGFERVFGNKVLRIGKLTKFIEGG